MSPIPKGFFECSLCVSLTAKLQAAEEHYEHVCAAWRGLADTINPEGTMMAHDAARHLVEDRDRFKSAVDRMKSRAEAAEAEVARLKDLPLEVAKRILAARDAMVAKDTDDAYNEIYWLNDMIESDPFKPWKDMEANVNLRTRIAELEAEVARQGEAVEGERRMKQVYRTRIAELEATNQVLIATKISIHQATEAALAWGWGLPWPTEGMTKDQYINRGLAALLGEGK